ncbi:MAG: cobalamin B12-binding domain-containing protein [Acidobacteria bacterium]|nr:cobalamin B12-binding domain-containing protein [Acidobacteriota bacterium]
MVGDAESRRYNFRQTTQTDVGSPGNRSRQGARVLLTSVCRPLGPAHGDAPSVGYELLHRQVTVAQGIFSPRATHHTFSLDYIAANVDSPTVVLQYPSRQELIRELRKGPEVVGVSFLLATFHRMKEVVALVRQYAPQALVVLGGYGTVVDDAMLAPYADHICREEGVGFFRKLLGEPPRPLPYDHPLLVSRLKVLSVPVRRTGMIFAGLGCPHGCDFCCTSHFFKRRHIRLLPTGDDVFRVIERYLEIDPKMSFTILDEDFLVARDRAIRLRELVQARGTPLSIFAFATVKALSRMTPQELLETGIDGVWMGFEGKRSGFAKQQGRPVEELIPDLRSHGISVLASMIVGFDYQTADVIREELAEFVALKPTLGQFLIYGPTPGTPFFERVVKEGRLHSELAANPERYYHACDGFTAMVRHPSLTAGDIESLQRECFETDFRVLGPSVLRSLDVWLQGWKRYHASSSAYLRGKAERWAADIRQGYPLLGVAKRWGPNPVAAARLQSEIEAALGPAGIGRRFLALAAPLAAAWTRFTLKYDRFQHPKLHRREYRTSHWALCSGELGSLRIEIERALKPTLVKLEGAMDRASARSLAAGILTHLQATDAQIHLVVAEGTQATRRQLRILGKMLARQRHRISVAIPSDPGIWAHLGNWVEVVPAPA